MNREPHPRPAAPVLRAVRQALDRESYAVQREPAALCSQLYRWLQADPHGQELAGQVAAARPRPWLRFLPEPVGDHPALIRTIPVDDRVVACRFTPNGSGLVVAEGARITMRSLDGVVTAELAAPSEIVDLAVSGVTLAAVGRSGWAAVWALAGTELGHWHAHDGMLRGCALTPDGDMLITAGGDDDHAHLTVWRTADGTLVRSLAGPVSAVRACTVTPDGAAVVSTGTDGGLWVHDLATGAGRRVVSHFDTGLGCATDPGARFLVIAGFTGAVTVWSPTGEEIATLRGHDHWALDCAVAPDGSLVVSAGDDGTVRLWDPTAEWAMRAFTGHTGRVNCCAISPDGRLVASGGVDATVRIWNADGSANPHQLHTDRVRACAVGPDGSWVATAGADGSICLWDLPDGTARACIRTTDSHYGVTALDDAVAAADMTGSLEVWDLDPLLPSSRYHRPRRTVVRPAGGDGWACARIADDRVAVIGARLAMVETTTGTIAWTASRIEGRSVARIDDDRLVASVGGGVRSWPRPESRKQVVVLSARTGAAQASLDLDADVVVNDVDAAPSGRRIVAACDDWALRVWNTTGGLPIAVLRWQVGRGLESNLRDIARRLTGSGERWGATGCRFLDEDRILVTGFDGSLRLWHVGSGAQVAVALLPSPILTLGVWRTDGLVVCGDASGGVHRLASEPGSPS